MDKKQDHMPPCHAVDFDGTLGKYDGWKGHYLLGAPIPAMLERVKEWIAKGEEVVIFTARVCEPDPNIKHQICLAFQSWCMKHVGRVLEVTCMKSPRFTDFYDDRNVAVEPNTGKILGRSRVD